MRIVYPMVLATLMWGCGKDSSSVTGNENNDTPIVLGLSPEPCKATFTKTYQVIDGFGEEEFSVKPGETFVIQDLDAFFGTRLYYEFPKGAYDFEVKKTSDGAKPYTSNCVEGRTQSYLAVFHTTTVYSDSALTRPLCTLNRGATAPTAGPTGFYLVGGFFSNLYHVELGGFASACQGASAGYLQAPEATVFGATTALVPINTYQTAAKE